MKVSLLNVRITIQKNTPHADSVGNRRLRWEDYLSCMATVSNETDTEEQDAGQTVDDTRADFTVRWCGKASVVNSTEYRVLFGGEIYNILAVDHMNYKRKSVKLRCRKARR